MIERVSQTVRGDGLSEALTPELPSQEDRIIASLGKILQWSRQPVHDRIQKVTGITIDRGDLPVLDLLANHGPMRISDIARMLVLDQSTMSRRVSQMIASRYLERRPDTVDRRASVIGLSPYGMDVRRTLVEAWRALVSDHIRGWTPGDRDALDHLLSQFAEAL